MPVEPSAQFSSYAQDPMIMHPYWMPPYQELKNMYTPELFDFNKFSSPPYLDAEYLDAAQNRSQFGFNQTGVAKSVGNNNSKPLFNP